MPLLRNIFFSIVLLCLAVFVTLPKTYHMMQLRGWVSGAVESRQVITHKWQKSRGMRDFYHITWARDTTYVAAIPSTEQLNIHKEIWNKLRTGDTVSVLHIPGVDKAYMRHSGVYSENTDIGFDVLLLLATLAGVFYLLRNAIAGLKRRRLGSATDMH